jgi:transglutaminase-like putative cysteine protease
VARTALLFVPCALLIALAWGRLEAGSDARLLGLAALALAPALLGPLWARALGAGVAALVAVRLATGLSPLDARPFDDEHDFVGPMLDRTNEGILAFYDVVVPFEAAERPLMDDVVQLAAFGFALAAALALAARRPLLTAAAVAGGVAWPVTLVRGSDVSWGAAVLGLALFLLALGGDTRPARFRPALAAAGVLVAGSLVATTSPAVAKGEFVDWRAWDPYDLPADPVGVRYVWNANYGGIRFPEEPTEVLRVTGPERPTYWRATTLDRFDGERWREMLRVIQGGEDEVVLTADPFLPAAARNDRGWLEAEVEVLALRDTRLAGPAMPVAYDPGDIGFVEYAAGNIARVLGGLERGDRYTVWAYVPRPTPARLGRVRPTALRRSTLEQPFLEVAPGRSVLPFGTGERDEQVEAVLAEPELAVYRPLVEQAREIAGDARNQYAAVVALEAWFRRLGGFTYDEQPPVPRDVPPLVGFVAGHKRGYCQHYAGAMTLMLRYLGIPARVAAGFTNGTYDADERRWTVRDTDAHTWVEVWFNGWGWLPFDPTPGRGRLSGTYSDASPTLDLPGLREALGGARAPRSSLDILGELQRSRVEGTTAGGRDIPGDIGGAAVDRVSRSDSLLRLLALVALGLLVAIAAAKVVRRRVRYLARDPRRVAAACRNELMDFLRDQRIDVSRSATPAELGDAVRAGLGADAGRFVGAVGAARYAPPEHAARAAREAHRELRRLLRALSRSLSPLARARGLLSLRSLGLGA